MTFQFIECPMCNKYFKRISARNQHVREVHKVNKIKCPECDRIYRSCRSLDRHRKYVHYNRKVNIEECNKCKNVFYTKWELEEHKKKRHPTCENCGISFKVNI